MGTFSYAAFFTGIRSAAFFLLILLTQTSCPDNPVETEDHPHQADCPNGFLPCESDSTICCEVICPPGTLLGGQDSTECIPVECPQYYHLCGPDSTDCCLDTTSHAMTWEVDTIFTGFVNYANDVAIIDDTTIWVVGEFELDDPEDTLTNFEGRFNLIKYDGKTWTLDRIMEPGWSSIARAEAIFAFSKNDVWVGNYGSPMYWNGDEWQGRAQGFGWESVGGNIHTIWGSGPDDVFFGSVDGQINHWDGTGFERMETPTAIHIVDIWGTGPNDVWAVGFDLLGGGISTVIHYDGNAWSLIYELGVTPGWESVETSLSGDLRAIQTYPFAEGEAWIMANTYGIYHKTLEESPDAELIPMAYTGHPLAHMRGNHPNDLFIAGHNSGMYHWNGISIQEYFLPGEVYMKGLVINNNQVFAVGWDTGYSIVFKGIKAE